MGRRSLLDQPCAEDPDGNPITVFDRIVSAIRAGCYLETAAATAGIPKSTVHEWIRIGTQDAIAQREHPRTIASHHQKRCRAFSEAVARAEGEWEAQANATLERLGRGGHQITHVTTKTDANGQLVEKTTKLETLEPNAQVLEWRLTRRFPRRYQSRVEVTGADGTPLLDPNGALERVRAHLEALAVGNGSKEPAGNGP